MFLVEFRFNRFILYFKVYVRLIFWFDLNVNSLSRESYSTIFVMIQNKYVPV